jgi:4-aminobutyrate aminotransferase-like enzyme
LYSNLWVKFLTAFGTPKSLVVEPIYPTFGKGMANGYPLSAVVGSNKVMQKVEDIFFSGTFGGETLSLAATNLCTT